MPCSSHSLIRTCAVDGGIIQILFFDQSSQLLTDDIVTIGEGGGEGEGASGLGSGIVNGDSFGGREYGKLSTH